MEWRQHVRTTATALKHWFVAMCYDALCVAALWLIGLLIIGIPLAPLWAILAGALQFIPNFGPMIAVIGPALCGAFSSDPIRFIYVLILFAVVMVVDGLWLQPYLMKRSAKVPFWASLITPIVLGIIIPFWGVLLAPPLLAIVYAFWRQRKSDQLTRL
jgi:predicted PurR-regulated permease PerM